MEIVCLDLQLIKIASLTTKKRENLTFFQIYLNFKILSFETNF